jgi:hypothetical protein
MPAKQISAPGLLSGSGPGAEAAPRNRNRLGLDLAAAPRNRNRLGLDLAAAPRNRLGRATLVTLSALLAMLAGLAGATPAQAAPARYEGVSADGGVAVFSTTDKLVPGDTDGFGDVYVRELDEGLGKYVTRQVSLGPTGGNDAYEAQFQAVDAGGDRVFFSTKERLTAADTDTAEDVYVRDLLTNKTTLVTVGDPSCAASNCGHANLDATAAPAGIADEGNRVFFVSSERLSSQDTDESPDLYVRDLEAGTTTLVSAAAGSCSGSCGTGPKPVVFQGASADGSKAIFTTPESLVGADNDEKSDLYERVLGSAETKLVSAPGSGPEPCPAEHNCEPVNGAISANGAHVFFETNERISSEDTDHSQDVYDWSGSGTAALVSIGPAGGNGIPNALYERSSANGDAVFFATDEQLVPADGDSAQDIYVRRGGETELVSAGDPSCSGCGNGPLPTSLSWVSPDGLTAVLTTAESLTAADTDGRPDVYARALPGGPTTLVSQPGSTCVDLECGNGPHDASFAGASADASHLFFVTDEALAPPATEDPSAFGDRDEQTDVYDRVGGATTIWVSAGQLGGGGLYSGNGEFDAQLHGVADEGLRTFVTTNERLTEADHDSEEDVYERSPSGTVLVSQGNDPELEAELAPPAPILEGTFPESPAASTEPEVYGSESVAEASIKLYTTADCSGEPVATGTTEELEEGIALTVAGGSITHFRATAEAGGFISSCSAALAYRQVDPEPPSEEEEEGGGGGGGGISVSPAPGSSSKQPGPLSKYQTPKTRITFGPAFKTRQRHPVFRFADATGQAGTGFLCKLDRHGWKPCRSPDRLGKLKRGKHVFEVKGINAAGVAEPRPTKRSFKLVGGR